MLNRNQIITLLIILAVLVCFVLFFSKEFFKKDFAGKNITDIKTVCCKHLCFSVEVVATPVERERGLMFRKNLSKNAGMLFIFDKPDKYSFWMRNTLIPLDIIWIDKNNRVVYMKENALPCKGPICEEFTPTKDALYVLEVNNGTLREKEIGGGDRVDFFY